MRKVKEIILCKKEKPNYKTVAIGIVKVVKVIPDDPHSIVTFHGIGYIPVLVKTKNNIFTIFMPDPIGWSQN